MNINSPTKNPNKEIRRLVRRWASSNLETMGVGTVVSIKEYSDYRLVDVLPLAIERESDGNARVPSVIYRCPVVLSGNLNGYLSFPVKVGDKVLLGFCKQSIAEYIFSRKAEQYLPDDLSVFGANNAVVLGFIAQAGVDKKVSSLELELNYSNSYLRITESNNIELLNPQASISISSSGNIRAANQVATIEAGSSGTVSITTGAGTFELTPSGVCTINGATITPSGNIITANGSDLDAVYAIYNTHTHDENNDSTTDAPNQLLP